MTTGRFERDFHQMMIRRLETLPCGLVRALSVVFEVVVVVDFLAYLLVLELVERVAELRVSQDVRAPCLAIL